MLMVNVLPGMAGFNSTVGLIYTDQDTGVQAIISSFQFHCWSDLYRQARDSFISTPAVSIPLLV